MLIGFRLLQPFLSIHEGHRLWDFAQTIRWRQVAESLNALLDHVHVALFGDVPLALCFLGIMLVGFFNQFSETLSSSSRPS